MITSIRINSYRNLEGVKLENLGMMNVIVGENNTGKTSLLECINLIKDENVLKNILDGIKWREYRNVYLGQVKRNYQMYHEVMNSFDLRQGANKYLSVDFETDFGEFSVGMKGTEFEDFVDLDNVSKRINDDYLDENNRTYNGLDGICWYNEIETNVEFTELKPYRRRMTKVGVSTPIEYISPITYYLDSGSYNNLNHVIKAGKKDLLLNLLQSFDANISDVNIIMEEHKPKVYLTNDELGMMPLALFGDGVKKALTVASAIICNQHGIVLIDEIETGIHKVALVEFLHWIMEMGKKCDTQIFATTHSIEAIDALLANVEKTTDNGEIVSFRLETDKSHVMVKRFSQNKLMTVRNELGYDIR